MAASVRGTGDGDFPLFAIDSFSSDFLISSIRSAVGGLNVGRLTLPPLSSLFLTIVPQASAEANSQLFSLLFSLISHCLFYILY